jgi:hypothetical protein
MLRSRALAVTCGVLGLWGCGGAAAPAPAQAPAPESTQATPARLTELDALERDFDVSAQQLAVQLQRREIESKPASEDADKPLEKKKDERAAAATPAPAPAANAGAPGADYAAIGGPCDLMCRALSSMRRSAGGICSLAGNEHERCRKAQLRLSLSEQQVQEAGCACSG